MASSRANKRVKVSSSAKESVTTLDNKAFDEKELAESKTHTKMTFRCPVTIDNVFTAPTSTQVKVFYESRSSKGEPFDHLPEGEKLAWTESFHDNKTLMGFIVYTQLFPKLLQNRIKLNAATYHWAHLDNSSEKGRTKLEQRRNAVDRLKRNGFTRSVFMGLPYRVDTSADILAYMKMDVEEEDERFRFFTKREFSMIFSKRGQVGSSSVYASCSMALSLLWFATAILARPCCLESIILPLSVTERRAMEQRFKCPPQFFDGPIQSFQTNWKDVFAAIDTHHRNINYTMLEKACEDKYIEGVHIADVYAVFRATMTAPDDMNSIAALVRSYNQHAKHGVESGAVVGVIDVIRDKSVEAIGKIDGGVLGSIFSAYGERACLKVQAECSRLEGGSSLFDDSVSNKLAEILAHFDCELWKARKKDKVERVVAANMDPAGMNKKIEGGKMLDPTDPKSIDLMHTMLQTISGQEEGEQLHKHVLTAGVTYTDVANLCTLLLLSFSFQRSQVLREATVDEFVLVPDARHYKFSFKNRRFKTASSGGTSSAPPVSHFMLSPDQSMITRFIAIVGHRFCGTLCLDNEARRLFVNTKGQSWTQKDISSRFKRIGMHWLGISNFGPHVCRTFWSTHALNSGQISGSNLEDFSSFLQVSSTTLRNSYMAAAANTAAHTVGNEVLGAVVNSACTGETTEKGARPYGKKLSARRLEFAGEIRASLAKYSGNGRLLFRALLQKRNASQLAEGEKWFRWENTFFSQSDERLFQRFVDKINA
ncbi:unnamed protein product [Ectocarpus sp. CCAP 1310/34]|nr:unnamed protein product [Ectocarpus sp. CCAP 1310/34]